MAKSKSEPAGGEEPQTETDLEILRRELEELKARDAEREQAELAKRGEIEALLSDLRERQARQKDAEQVALQKLDEMDVRLQEVRGMAEREKAELAAAATNAQRAAVEHNQVIVGRHQAGKLKWRPRLYSVASTRIDHPAVELLATDPSDAIRLAALCFAITDTAKHNWRVKEVPFDPGPKVAVA